MTYLHNNTTIRTSFLFDDAKNLLKCSFKYHNFLNFLKLKSFIREGQAPFKIIIGTTWILNQYYIWKRDLREEPTDLHQR